MLGFTFMDGLVSPLALNINAIKVSFIVPIELLAHRVRLLRGYFSQ